MARYFYELFRKKVPDEFVNSGLSQSGLFQQLLLAGTAGVCAEPLGQHPARTEPADSSDGE
jgi:hypothetical protein